MQRGGVRQRELEAVDTWLQPGEQRQLFQQEGEESYRVSPLGKHCCLREDVSDPDLEVPLLGIRRGSSDDTG